MSNATNDRNDNCEDWQSDEDCVHDRYMQVDPDGAVRIYRYDEKLGRYVVDEKETASLEPEFVEEFRTTINERRYIAAHVTHDDCWCSGDRDWGHASGW